MRRTPTPVPGPPAMRPGPKAERHAGWRRGESGIVKRARPSPRREVLRPRRPGRDREPRLPDRREPGTRTSGVSIPSLARPSLIEEPADPLQLVSVEPPIINQGGDERFGRTAADGFDNLANFLPDGLPPGLSGRIQVGAAFLAMRDPPLVLHALEQSADGVAGHLPGLRESPPDFTGRHFSPLPDDLHDLILSGREFSPAEWLTDHGGVPH